MLRRNLGQQTGFSLSTTGRRRMRNGAALSQNRMYKEDGEKKENGGGQKENVGVSLVFILNLRVLFERNGAKHC